MTAVPLSPRLDSGSLQVPAGESLTMPPRRPSYRAIVAFLLGLVIYFSIRIGVHHPSNHQAYLVALSVSTFGVCSLIILGRVNLHCVLKRLQSTSDRNVRLLASSPQAAISCIAVLQTISLAFFGLSAAFASNLHSPSPIDGAEAALARVHAELRAIAAAKYAHISQSTCCVGILLVTLAAFKYVPLPQKRSEASSEQEPKRAALGSVLFFIFSAVTAVLIRSISSLIKGESDPAKLLDVPTSGLGFWGMLFACWAIAMSSHLLQTAYEKAEDEEAEVEQLQEVRDEKAVSPC